MVKVGEILNLPKLVVDDVNIANREYNADVSYAL
jgi:hypothetical protein